MGRWIRHVALSALLAGCAAPVPRIEGPPGVDLSTLAAWDAAGRIAVAAGDQGGSGSFSWEQRGNLTQVRLQGPVGIGGLVLTVDDTRVRLESSDGTALESDAAWAELEKRLGAPVPARNLRYWLLGVPAPGPHRWLPADPPAARLEQDDWHIAYERFGDHAGTRLPARLTATSGTTRVRLVIDRWQLAPAAD